MAGSVFSTLFEGLLEPSGTSLGYHAHPAEERARHGGTLRMFTFIDPYIVENDPMKHAPEQNGALEAGRAGRSRARWHVDFRALWRHTGIRAAIALAVGTTSTVARADDEFWARDKALHFAVAGAIAGV